MELITVDPVADAAICAGNPTVAPSAGEVITTVVAAVDVPVGVGSGVGGAGAGGAGAGAGAGAGVPLVVPPVLLPEELLPPGSLLPELLPPEAAPPELEPEDGGVLALPLEVPEDVPEPGLLAPVAGELAEGRVELADVVNELGPAEPPHPTIAAIKKKENNIRLCRMRTSENCVGTAALAVPLRETMDASTLVILGKLLRVSKDCA